MISKENFIKRILEIIHSRQEIERLTSKVNIKTASIPIQGEYIED